MFFLKNILLPIIALSLLSYHYNFACKFNQTKRLVLVVIHGILFIPNVVNGDFKANARHLPYRATNGRSTTVNINHGTADGEHRGLCG